MLFDKTTQQYLKKYSPVPSNYDVSNLLPYVSIAEKIWVIPIIGNDLYQEIDEQLHTPSGGTLSPENATLLTESGGLWQYLAFATLLEGLPFIWVSLTEAGLQLGKSDNSDSVSLKDLTLIQTHIRNQVIIQRELLVKYLCSHTDSFPLFDTSVCPDCQCSCGNKGAKLYSAPKPIYKPTKGCVGTSIVTTSSSSVDLSNYYTKDETNAIIDNKIESAITSGIDLDNYWTSAQTEQAITQAISGKADASVVSALTEEVAANSYNIGELQDAIGDMALDSEVVHKGLTETITGNKTFSSDTTFNGAVTLLGEEAVIIGNESLEDILQEKLDVTAYTPTDLSEYWTSAQTSSAITSAVSGKADTSSLEAVAFTGDYDDLYNKPSIPRFELNNGILNIIVP